MASKKHPARRSLRLRLLILLLVPLLSLGTLWALATYLTAHDALGKYKASTTMFKVAVPGFGLTAALEQERVESAVLVSPEGRQERGTISATRARTDAAEVTFRRSALAENVQRSMSAVTKKRLEAVLTQLAGLGGVRAQIDAGTVDALGVINDYDAVIDPLFHVYGSVELINDPGVYQQNSAILSTSIAGECMMREDTLVEAALATRRKRLTGQEYTLFERSAANGRYLFESALVDMQTSVRAPLDRLAASPEYTTFRDLEDAIVAGGTKTSLMPKADSWRVSVKPMVTTWPQANAQAGAILTAEAKPIGNRITFMLYAVAGFGLLTVLFSIVVSVLFGRGLARELTGLQHTALDVAMERLPRVIKRLRAGEKVDVDAEVPSVQVGMSSEAAKVAEALTTLQRTAIEAAIGEARLRQGINQVFLNLAWRSQSLLHRQLSMLDTMERQASDPDALEGLFALDHLTTRMRRHAEGLVILSGSAPARGWHHPVAVRDILRGAIAEVEDYTRVVVEAVSPAALDGSVVADVTHLLAELIENATAFSPPPTNVQVRGELTAQGYAIEVEDRGIGMNDEELADANQRLAEPPEFDLADSDRLGLFIVGRLAARHKIDVKLMSSPYGGACAVVLVPLDFIAGDDGSDFDQSLAEEPSADSGWRPAPMRRTAAPPGALPQRVSASADATGAVRTAPGVAPASGPLSPGPVAGSPIAGSVATGRVDDMRDRHGNDAVPELPRRIRQANLAPQLRRDPPASEPVGLDPLTTRAPEETRSLMAALQQGWQRGREEQDLDE